MRVPWLVLAAFVAAAPAAAADLPPPEPVSPEAFESRWSAAFGIYGWAAGINGDVGVAGRGPFPVDLSFTDVLGNLDVALMAAGEVRFDRFGVFADLFYTRLSAEEDVLRGLARIGVTNDLLAATAMGQVRVVEQGGSSLDLMAGGRVWSVGGELDVTLPRRRLERDKTETWVDPMIGAKARVQGDWPVYATGWAMIGGFGAGAELDWDLLAAVGYEINNHVSILAGYRAVGIDYENDGFVFDTVLSGPVISGVIRF